MCGIAGIAGTEVNKDYTPTIRRMTEAIGHRGPDAEGYFIENGIALGHRRLSIIDLSAAANQPIFDQNERYSLILNGEIYNFREVRAELKEFKFRTESDTEVILAAYAKYGPNCLQYLNGMFAFAIWDTQLKELFFARDRLGVKPLYYAITGSGNLIFASEIRSILASDLVPKKLSTTGLNEYLMYQSVYSPNTIVEGIQQLKSGHYAVYKDGKFSPHKYWGITDDFNCHISKDVSEVKRSVRELLTASVERRMISDVRLGAFLSGGIDSSAVVGLMAEISDEPIDTFSVAFDDKDFDESRYSDLVAKRFNTRHTSVRLSPEAFLEELPNALAATDAPSGDGINTYVVSKATRAAGIKVALSGLGGDELFAGYPNFIRWLKLQNGTLSYVPTALRQTAGRALALSPYSKHQRGADLLNAPSLSIADIYPMFRQVMSQQFADSFVAYGNGRPGIRSTLDEHAHAIGAFPLLSQFSIAEIIGYTQNVLLRDTDQYSMASALEVREPFFDYKLIEYVLRIPDEFKYPRFPKSLLVESLHPLLPDEIVHRKKMGFVLPWEKWMKNDLFLLCESRISSLSSRSIIDSERLSSHWKAFQEGKVAWSQVWHLVVLADWLDANGF